VVELENVVVTGMVVECVDSCMVVECVDSCMVVKMGMMRI
jgi:hypothetical protein